MVKLFRVAALAMLSGAAAQIVSGSEAMAAEPVAFIVVIRNVATPSTLRLPDGKTTTAPIAPGVYALIEGGAQLFAADQLAPQGLESLAEDGDGQALLEAVSKMKGVRNAGLFVPGQPFTIKAEPGQRLVFATMFVQSNDKFYAPAPAGIALFDGRKPVAGDLTKSVMLWDAGTEKDEPPGVGPNQAPRQPVPNTGPAEGGTVHLANDGFVYPAVSDVIQLTVLPHEKSNSPS
jgi:hypothetical protein